MRHIVMLAAALGAASAVVACVAGLDGAAPASALPASRAPAISAAWGKAEQVPGLAALAGSGSAELTSLSCGSRGNCSAGGFYQPGDAGGFEPFLVSEVNGTWGTAQQVPGIATLNVGGQAQVRSVSCASAGNCAAVGFYTSGRTKTGQAKQTAFVVSQVSGVWGTAQPVPGLAALNTGNAAQLDSVACPAAGDCAAGGSYGVERGSGCCGHSSGFVVSQVSGTWGTAHPVPGSGEITSVSCSSAGNCGAAGGLVVTQTAGTWSAPHRITGPPGATFGQVTATIMACPAPGECEAAGQGHRMVRGVVASEFKGHWGHAREFDETAKLTKRGSSVITSLSCPAAGGCTAAGYAPRTAPEGSSTREFAVPWVVSQNGHFRWNAVESVTGIGTLSKHGFAVISVLSCTSAGTCGVGGTYSTSSDNPDGSGPGQVFVTSDTDADVASPHDVTSALGNDGEAQITSISCPAAGRCGAGGYYFVGDQQRAFVVSQG